MVPVRRPRHVFKAAPRSIVDLIVQIGAVQVSVIPGGEDALRMRPELINEVTGLLVPVAAR